MIREAVPGDRRAIRLKLTREGRSRFADMAREHEAWVIGLMAPLSATEQRTLRDLLGKLKTGLHAEPDPAAPHRPARPLRSGG